MKILIGLPRFIAFAIISVMCILYYAFSGIFLGYTIERGFKIRTVFIRVMLVVLNVDLKIYGQVPSKSFKGIIIANHRSYFDPVAILKDIDAISVAKSQVSNWPIIGI